MKFKDLDVVDTLVPFPEEGIKKGERGTVVASFSVPAEAYEVEFVNEDGSTRAMFAIKPEHLRRISLSAVSDSGKRTVAV